MVILKVEVLEEEITISIVDGPEVVHWVHTEWEEDPTVVPAIANAIRLAYTAPAYLVELNRKHIDSQEQING